MDTFIEYMVARKKTAKDKFMIFGSIILALILTYVLFFFSAYTGQYLFMLWFLAVAGVWYGFYVYISRKNIEYEYSFTNGELDVDVIYSKRRRVHLLTVRVKEFLICAPVYSSDHEAEYVDAKGINKIYNAAASMSDINLYFADFHFNGDRVRLIFGPPNNMINAIKKYNIKNVFVKES